MGNHYDPRDEKSDKEIEQERRMNEQAQRLKDGIFNSELPSLSIRDHFAMAALTGLLTRGAHDHDKRAKKRYYNLAYEIADGMLEARKVKA